MWTDARLGQITFRLPFYKYRYENRDKLCYQFLFPRNEVRRVLSLFGVLRCKGLKSFLVQLLRLCQNVYKYRIFVVSVTHIKILQLFCVYIIIVLNNQKLAGLEKKVGFFSQRNIADAKGMSDQEKVKDVNPEQIQAVNGRFT